ncbi:hypothetical protein ICQ57_002201 [Salmonella enterica]|nr:hypothetical protein [Salmonella enterica]
MLRNCWACSTAVFPAPAGINRKHYLFEGEQGSVPRASGDKPDSIDQAYPMLECSPRQRG